LGWRAGRRDELLGRGEGSVLVHIRFLRAVLEAALFLRVVRVR